MTLKNILKTVFIMLLGALVGIITGYTRSYHSFSFWAFSDFSNKFGFWITTVSIIAVFSKSKKLAVQMSI